MSPAGGAAAGPDLGLKGCAAWWKTALDAFSWLAADADPMPSVNATTSARDVVTALRRFMVTTLPQRS